VLLTRSFYKLDTEEVACGLLGCCLCHETEEGLVSGIIVETEAYLSRNDPACHASRGMTRRNATMFGPPGHAYIYFIYGNHYCFNIVTGPKGLGEAVLIRAVEPVSGLDLMYYRRGKVESITDLTSGPGKLCQAFAIDKKLDGHDLRNKPLFICGKSTVGDRQIVVTPRIGISSAKDKKLRFIISGNKYLSRRESVG
jgi:DNA-3-methyladenine glycosylase